MKIFADVTKLWCRIGTESDSESLQKDLDSLANWSQKWMLEFNSSKCKVMHVGHKLNTKYFMNDKDGNMELSAVQEEKDLGVFFTSDLKASTCTQCTKSAAKTRRIIGMVRRNFKRLDKNDFLVIYKAEGIDEIPAELLKCMENTAVKVFTHLCQKNYETGKWPADFLQTVIIPLEKKPNATECSDFRTISLLEHAAKVLIRVVLTKRIEAKANAINHIQKDQFGFRKGKGTRDAIATLRVL